MGLWGGDYGGIPLGLPLFTRRLSPPSPQEPGKALIGAVLATVGLGVLAAAATEPALAQEGQAPQIPRDGWKDCTYNDQELACVDEQIPGGLQIRWKDGQRMTYRELPGKGDGGTDLLRDRLGGIWRRELFIQGNVVLTNTANGNRIFVPLRFPCRPPLKGEVGYCRY